MRLRSSQQEQTLSEPNLQLHRMVVAEEVLPVEGGVDQGFRPGTGGVRRERPTYGQEVRGELFHRKTGTAAHVQDSSATAASPARRTSGTRMMSGWKTIVGPTEPCTLKMHWRRCILMPLPIRTS